MIKKSIRVLWIHEELHQKHFIELDDLVERFHSSSKTIRRDLDDLRTYYAEKACQEGGYEQIVFDRNAKVYRLVVVGEESRVQK